MLLHMVSNKVAGMVSDMGAGMVANMGVKKIVLGLHGVGWQGGRQGGWHGGWSRVLVNWAQTFSTRTFNNRLACLLIFASLLSPGLDWKCSWHFCFHWSLLTLVPFGGHHTQLRVAPGQVHWQWSITRGPSYKSYISTSPDILVGNERKWEKCQRIIWNIAVKLLTTVVGK